MERRDSNIEINKEEEKNREESQIISIQCYNYPTFSLFFFSSKSVIVSADNKILIQAWDHISLCYNLQNINVSPLTLVAYVNQIIASRFMMMMKYIRSVQVCHGRRG